MNCIGKARWLAYSATVLLAACSSPGTVHLDLVSTTVEKSSERLKPEFVTETTTAAIAIDDWDKVAELANITGNTDKRVQYGDPAISPNQDALVFIRLERESSTVIRQSFESPSQSPITTGNTLDLAPTFTPDGEYLVFSSNRSGEGQHLWRIRSDGAGGVTQVTSSTSFDHEPAVAADGETVVFQSHRLNNIQPAIWSVSMGGGMLTQLTDGESPRVSPDGLRVAFVRPSPDGKNKQIWLMNIDGSGLTRLSNNSANEIDPSWHPNGRLIVFASDEAQKEEAKARDYDIWMMQADGTRRVQLTQNISRDDSPAFDRHGRTIVFRSNRGGAWNIFSFQPVMK